MVYDPAGGADQPRLDKQSMPMSVKLIGLPDNEALSASLCYFTLHLFLLLLLYLRKNIGFNACFVECSVTLNFGRFSRNC